MVKDFPDWTDSIQVIGTEIMMPVDLQGAFIMMPIDIQAQYIDLAIDIVAQTIGNVAIDLAAQTVGNIEVDIKAQTIGNLVIDIEAQSVGITLKPEWEVKSGNALNVRGLSDAMMYGNHATVIDYTVLAGKTLYIYGLQGGARSNVEGDAAKVQNFHIDVTLGGIGTVYLTGDRGVIWTLAVPMKITTGNHVIFEGWNYSGHTIRIVGSFIGFQI